MRATIADPPTAGDAIDLRLKLVAQRVEQQPLEVEAIVARMRQRVDDDRLKDGFCRKVAWAIVEGLYPSPSFERILSSAASKPTASERGKYFVGAIRKSFSDRGVPLERSK